MPPPPPLLGRLYARIPKGLVPFLAVGVVGLATDLSILTLLERFGVHQAVARAVSLAAATLVTWNLNRRLTFTSSGRDPRAELARYALVALLAQGVNYCVFLEILHLEPRTLHALAAILGAIVATAFSYTGQRFVTFAQRRSARRA